MEKNTLVRTIIEDMTEQGEGIGKADGYTLFIKDTVIGDVVEARVIKAKKTYGYGKLVRVLTPSPQRTQPRCPVAAPCGGCQLQAMSYESQLAFKRRKVENHLRRLGGLTDVAVEPVIGMKEPYFYRNKCQVPVGRGRDGKISMGFYAGRTHSIIETERCYLGHPVNERILQLIRSHMAGFAIAPYDERTGRGLVRHVLIRVGYVSGQIMVCLVLNGRKLPHADLLVKALREIPGMTSITVNINREQTNVILGRELVNLYGPGYIVDQIGDISYQISPLSFYQVNTEQTGKLYQKVLEFAALTGKETVWDLYCGIGAISLFLAREAREVHGVEIIPAAVENARANAEMNHIQNADFTEGRAEDVLPAFCRRHLAATGRPPAIDVIVVDPPRKGCDRSLLSLMADMRPSRIVYVSCDSATLARDLKVLCGSGYEVQKVQPVDMFPMTTGVETVCQLVLRKPVVHVNIDVDVDEPEKEAAIRAALEHFGMI